MKVEITDKFVGYHYSNPRAYKSMQTKGIAGYTSAYDNFAGLVPSKRFIRLGEGNGLPYEVHDGVIEGLLEPEPKSWLKNQEFPHLWYSLMHDICRENEVMLLSFEFKSEDRAYVVERAHVERELYREAKGQGKPTRESMNEAFKKYWKSKAPVFDYDGSYSVPQLSIWSPIEIDRLKVEWIKPTDPFWKRIVDNGW